MLEIAGRRAFCNVCSCDWRTDGPGKRFASIADRATGYVCPDGAVVEPVTTGELHSDRDLLLSPDHCLLVDDVLIPAKLLINETTITQEAFWQPFEYFHIELDRHDARARQT